MEQMTQFHFDQQQMEGRFAELLPRVREALSGRSVCTYWKPLEDLASVLDGEDKLYFLIVATHFGDNDLRSSRPFYNLVSWETLQTCSGLAAFQLLTNAFFQSKPFFGDHRKHLRSGENLIPEEKGLPKKRGPEARLEYTWNLLDSYRDTIRNWGSATAFFATDGSVSFDTLFSRMTKLRYFDRRLPRFDHLERLARTHNFYITPDRMYADLPETAGPRDGLTYLVLGKRFRKEGVDFRSYLVRQFPAIWNEFAPEYRIAPGANCDAVIRSLDRWAVAEVARRLAAQNIDKRALVFELESCLCDWQKGK
jgi:hypothetical protein